MTDAPGATVMDEATARFLETAADDLQRQLRTAGHVEAITLEADTPGLALVAHIRVGDSIVTMRGTGENLVEAYGDLHRESPVPLLTAAFRQLLENA
jgi:hypothetical protein